jgi:ClpP class serine protease
MWLLKTETLQAMREARSRGYEPTAEERIEFAAAMREAHASKTADAPRNMKVAGNVAQIDVRGVLTEEPDCFALLFGGGNTSYRSIRKAVEAAEGDASVEQIVLNIDSPGGTVSGLFETLAALEGARKPISVRASMACSAAFALAAMAGPIQANTVASEFGSIGVACSLSVDDERIDLTSTEAPNKRPNVSTDEGKAVVVEQLDAIHELFADAIARGRSHASAKDIAVSDVNKNYGRGSVLLAGEAKKRGMVDTIASQPKRARKAAPAMSAEIEVVPTAEGGTEKNMDSTQFKAQHPDLYAAAVAEGAANERKRVNAHLKLGTAYKAMDVAMKAIAEGKSSQDEEVAADYQVANVNRLEAAARQADSDAARP